MNTAQLNGNKHSVAAARRRARARRQDLEWMVETGEYLTGALTRLGVSREALLKWCKEHQCKHLYDALYARDPYYVAQANQHSDPADVVNPVRSNRNHPRRTAA